MVRAWSLLWILLLLTACSGVPPVGPDVAMDVPAADVLIMDSPSTDGAIPDASNNDATITDASADDAPSMMDVIRAGDAANDGDSGFDPLLALTGSCGVLDTELTDTMPSWVENTSTFPAGWTRMEASRLSTGAQTILAEGTAGGSSSYSEAFAFEVLHRCEGASLVRTETMIRYSVPMPGSITDILVEIDGVRIGVSVTRAVTVTGMCMRADTFDMARATELLSRKLAGINESTMLVAPEDRWRKQILFVYADTATHATVLRNAWMALDPALRADTILYVSVSEGTDGFIYFEDRCL